MGLLDGDPQPDMIDMYILKLDVTGYIVSLPSRLRPKQNMVTLISVNWVDIPLRHSAKRRKLTKLDSSNLSMAEPVNGMAVLARTEASDMLACWSLEMISCLVAASKLLANQGFFNPVLVTITDYSLQLALTLHDPNFKLYRTRLQLCERSAEQAILFLLTSIIACLPGPVTTDWQLHIGREGLVC